MDKDIELLMERGTMNMIKVITNKGIISNDLFHNVSWVIFFLLGLPCLALVGEDAHSLPET